jgi:hypothetical protein
MARQEVTLIVRIQDEYHAQAQAYTADEQCLSVHLDAHHQQTWHEVYCALKKQRVYVALQCPEYWFSQELLTPPPSLQTATPLHQDDWVQQQLMALQGAAQAPFYWDYIVDESAQWQLYYLPQSRLAPWQQHCQRPLRAMERRSRGRVDRDSQRCF